MADRSQDFAPLSEIDLSLVNTLQIEPRAPWSRIGRALDLDPVTVARRWARLVDSGAAWITAQPGTQQTPQSCVVLVELDCVPGRALDVADVLVDWPHVLTLEHTSGGRDLLLTVAVPDLVSLSRYLLESLGALPDVRDVRTQPVTHVFAQGGGWRLRALDAEQRALLDTGGAARTDNSAHQVSAQDRRLILRLGEDGRMSLTDLAAAVGLGVSTVRRRVGILLAREAMWLRCEVAQPLSGWPVSLWLWTQVPADDRDTIAALLRSFPEIRACLGLTGTRANLVVNVWLRTVSDTHRLEARLVAEVPRLTVVDRALVLRFAKRMGRVLDAGGRSVRTVPMDVWSDPVRCAG